MKSSFTARLLACALIACVAIPSAIFAQEQIALTASDINAYTRSTSRSLAGIHDPSIVQDGSQFYIMGTHRGFARSSDLISWTGLNMRFARVGTNGAVTSCNADQAFSVPQVKKVKALVNGQVQEVDFPAFDAQAWAKADVADYNINGNLWAPDIIYNPTMKKWCMYMSVNGDNWHSSIVLLTSSSITGEFVYQGPVTISGFINGSNQAISWKKTDLELVIGTQSSLPARYNRGNDWGRHWPNNIDPCVFYDDNGQLWMSYGSWSGGIYMLKLDPETGLRDYTVTYPLTPASGDHASSDPYYGKHIAGGYYVSGEGSYIQKIGSYYYMFLSYGGLESKGGYVMRLFRSKNPDGPYFDTQNVTPIYDRYQLNFGPGAATNRGFLLMSAYKDWGFQTAGQGRVAQGHNSAFVDKQGRAFVVYHTRYNAGNEGFNDRVHQLFVNDLGWLVCSPFEYSGETLTDDDIKSGCQFTDEQLVGEYSLLLHRYQLDHANLDCVTPVTVTLTDKGKVTGDMTGTWKRTSDTGYITLVLGNNNYHGVVTEQTIEGTSAKAICISALCNSTGQPVWAYRMEPQYAVAYTAKNYEIPIKNGATVSRNLPLYGVGYGGATIEWQSSAPDIIAPDGHFTAPETTTDVNLTCHISAGNYYYDQSFTVKASKNSISDSTFVALLTPIAAFYDFDETTFRNLYDENQRMTGVKGATGTKPTRETDPERDGSVVHLYGGNTANTSSYLYAPNPLAGVPELTGFTMSMWVKRGNDDISMPLWSITDKRANLSTAKQRLYFTGNCEVTFDNGTDHFEANRPDGNSTSTGYIPVGEWAFVCMTCDAEGITTYVNGTRKTIKTFTSSAGEESTVAKSVALFDYQKVLDMVATAEYLQLGLGIAGAGSPEAWIDNLIVHSRALTQTDVRTLNILANRVTDYTKGVGTGIRDVDNGQWEMDNGQWIMDNGQWTMGNGGAVYDLTGRRVAYPQIRKGIYVINGRKVMVR